MRADVRDAKVLQELAPSALELYLQAHNWHKVGAIPERASIWQPDVARSSPEVIVPLKTDFADYALRVSEIIQTLSKFEDRPQLEIIAELSVTQADVIRIRVATMKDESGTIALNDGVTLYQAARDMLMAAACATVNPKPLYQTRKPDEAVNYMDGVLIGPSEQGSFIAKIISPSSPRLETTQPSFDFGTPEPFERRVTTTLNRALTEMQKAAREAKIKENFDFGPFEKAVKVGVSANLCKAIHTLASLNADNDLHMRFSWSHARRDTKMLSEKITINHRILPTLKEAMRLFEERTPQDDFELEGLVTELKREGDNASGTATVVGSVEGKIRKVRLSIGSTDYDRAIDAHKETRRISVQGELIREGRTYELRNPRNFELLDQED